VSLRVLRLAGKWSGRWESNPNGRLIKACEMRRLVKPGQPRAARLQDSAIDESLELNPLHGINKAIGESVTDDQSQNASTIMEIICQA
jgi:hypothetical protein